MENMRTAALDGGQAQGAAGRRPPHKAISVIQGLYFAGWIASVWAFDGTVQALYSSHPMAMAQRFATEAAYNEVFGRLNPLLYLWFLSAGLGLILQLPRWPRGPASAIEWAKWMLAVALSLSMLAASAGVLAMVGRGPTYE